MNWQEFWLKHKKKIIVIAVALVIIIAGLIVWQWWSERPPKTVVLNQPSNTGGTPATSTPVTAITAPEGGEAVVAARNFSERFGSYSSQNPYGNIRELFPLMTVSLQSTFSNLTGQASNDYQGVESRAISMKVMRETLNSAEIMVTLQRRERDAALAEKVYYQDLRLILVKSANIWLIDSASWQKK